MPLYSFDEMGLLDRTACNRMEGSHISNIIQKNALTMKLKEKELVKCDEVLNKLRDEIHNLSRDLKKTRTHEQGMRLGNSRISTHKSRTEFDKKKRPSDREYNVRLYSQMDKDTWRYDGMRDWFNKYSGENENHNFIPSETGYTFIKDD